MIDPNYQTRGDFAYAQNLLDESYMNTRNSYVAQEEQRRFELARTEKYDTIKTALGVDKNQMDDIVGLTGLDVQTAAMIYGAKVQDITSIREVLGTLGMELILRGQGAMAQGLQG